MNIHESIINDLEIESNSFNTIETVKEAKILFNKYFDIKAQNDTKSFDENIWSFKDLITGQSFLYKFDSFIPLITFNKKINKQEFMLALKCWTIYNISFMTPSVTFKQYRNLLSICHFTKGFNLNFDELNQMTSNYQIYHSTGQRNLYTIKKVKAETAKRYIKSLISFSDFYNKLPIDTIRLNTLSSTADKLKIINSPRDLPKPSDILNFKDCVETHYKELMSSDVNKKNELITFYPLILWWDLTAIIPMRPSEFCLIKRDCLSNDKITFPRFKQKRNKAKSRERIVYDSLPIPKHLAEKIKHYIGLTDEFGHSEYLISLPAYLELTLINKKSNVDYSNKYFTNEYLRKLIKRFYQEIVIGKYKIEVQEQLKPGDLRHIAIISMMLQGYDRVEIERLAGHFDLNTQYSYVNHMQFWVDTEIQTLANQFKLQNKDKFISPKAIDEFHEIHDKLLFTEIQHPSLEIENFIELEIGYCMDQTMPCPTFNWNYTGCYFCKHWGISLEELQNKKEQIIEELSSIHNELKRKVNYLSGLYTLHQLDEYGNKNPELKTELMLTTQGIEHDKKVIARLYNLLGAETNE